MHELSITANIVSIVAQKAGNHKVLRVKLEIGELSAIEPESVRFCFDVCAKGTVLQDAMLEIDQIKPLGRCQDCGREFALELMSVKCKCGSANIACIAGNELKIKEMEIA